MPYYCQDELQSQQLLPAFNDWKLADTPLYLIYHKDNHQPQRLKVFENFIIEAFKTDLIKQ